jgi:hypothetical protein
MTTVTFVSAVMNAEDAVAHLNHNVNGLLRFASAKFDSLSKGIGEKSYAISSKYIDKLLSVVRKVLTQAHAQPSEFYEAKYREIVKALSHVRYISFEDLTAANNANIDLLSEWSEGKSFCIMVPSRGEREKSNMWFTLLSAARLWPTYSACISCDRDVQALRGMSEDMDCLFF